MARSRALLFLAGVAVFSVWLWTTSRQRPLDDTSTAKPPTLEVSPLDGSLQPPGRLIRVNVTARPVAEIDLKVDKPYQIRPVGDVRLLGTGDRLAATTVTVERTGFRIAGKRYPVTRLEIVPQQSPAIWIGGHQYRGTVRLFRQPGGKLIAVNVLPLEEYVASVVDSEMPAAFPPEARKAQAVVARTYALYQMSRVSRSSLFDVRADTRSQKYLGFQYRDSTGRLLAGETASGRDSARQTRGVVCTYHNRLFCTYYSAVCGGKTLEGSVLFKDAVAAVASVPCEYCREAKYYRWHASIPSEELGQRIQSTLGRGSTRGTLISLSEIPRTKPGGLQRYQARYQHGEQQLRSDKLRAALSASGVRSPHFEVRREGPNYVIQGRGHGHGVGLCQWGARGQALAGRNFRQILRYYYPGAELVIIQRRGSRN